ncbi:hypothetical protein N7490_006744 [Penicillium lividum]|nr:hypothetical protein N7490_006744 [Penicillium lividum]
MALPVLISIRPSPSQRRRTELNLRQGRGKNFTIHFCGLACEGLCSRSNLLVFISRGLQTDLDPRLRQLADCFRDLYDKSLATLEIGFRERE